MVSGDTGPTHIAAAVGTPIVGIYGPTRPERNGPWRPGDETVSRAAVCRCHHLRRCRAGTMCLLDIPVDEVARAVGRVLEQAADRRRARRT
jgi:ADP-heptose:LPS heptosyltransferase